jgi:hypothetical protein
VHAEEDVAPADELAVEVDLRDGGPFARGGEEGGKGGREVEKGWAVEKKRRGWGKR